MKLKIGAKINILVVVSLIFVGGSAIFLSIRGFSHSGDKASAEYRTNLMNEKKDEIRNLVTSAFSIIDEKRQESQDTEKLKQQYSDQVKAAVDQTISIFQSVQADETLDPAARKQLAKKIIKDLRWGPKSSGYFWIQDTDGIMVMHPFAPKLNGQPLFHRTDPDGKHLFKEMDEVTKADGAGFVEYKWPKPGFDKPLDKISYVRLFRLWDWIIGTGIYIETAEKALKQQAANTIGAIRYGKDSDGYFFILDSKGKMIRHPFKPELQGQSVLDVKDPVGKYLFREIIDAVEKNKTGDFC